MIMVVVGVPLDIYIYISFFFPFTHPPPLLPQNFGMIRIWDFLIVAAKKGG